MESGESRFGKIGFTVSCDVTKSFRRAVQEVDENSWQPITYTDEYGNRGETGQEVAEVCFIPETKNKKKDAPVSVIWQQERQRMFNVRS